MKTKRKPVLVKISANFPKDDLELLRSLAERLGINMTDVLRNAIKLEEFVQDAKDQGAKVLIKRKDGALQELMVR